MRTVNFTELEEVMAMIDRVLELEPEHVGLLQPIRDSLWFTPGQMDDLHAFLEAAIEDKGWTWELWTPGICIRTDHGDSVAIPGAECPRSQTHSLLSAYMGALEADEEA